MEGAAPHLSATSEKSLRSAMMHRRGICTISGWPGEPCELDTPLPRQSGKQVENCREASPCHLEGPGKASVSTAVLSKHTNSNHVGKASPWQLLFVLAQTRFPRQPGTKFWQQKDFPGPHRCAYKVCCSSRHARLLIWCSPGTGVCTSTSLPRFVTQGRRQSRHVSDRHRAGPCDLQQLP